MVESMSRRAFFIIGPEGSGTYMLAEAFVAAGCTYCDKDDVVDFLEEQQPELLVIRRSLPHAGDMPNIIDIDWQLADKEYQVFYIWLIRDQASAQESTSKRKKRFRGDDFKDAIEFIGEFYPLMGGRMISYEYFVSSIKYRQSIFNGLGLVSPREMEFYDANAKYYV